MKSGHRNSRVRSICGGLLLLLLATWGVFLYSFWQQNTSLDRMKRLDEFAHEGLVLLNSTKSKLRSEWTHIKHVIHDWKEGGSETSFSPLESEVYPNHVVGENIANQDAAIDNSIGIDDGSDVHIIFSTDCKPFMDYQTLVLFHSAQVALHKGPVTRIVSGCNKDKEEYLHTLYRKLFPQYHVHFTPDFSYDPITKKTYVYWNKPHGLKHWLEHANPPVGKEVIVALLDPDMIILRPITSRVRGADNLIQNIPEDELFDRVTRGKPAGAIYGLGTQDVI
jgi:hypothetical protein